MTGEIVAKHLCPVEGCVFSYTHRIDYMPVAAELLEAGAGVDQAVTETLNRDARAVETVLRAHVATHGDAEIVLAGINLTYVSGGQT